MSNPNRDVTVIGFGPGASSFSGTENDETPTVPMDGREVVLTKSEFWKFLRMRFREEVKPETSSTEPPRPAQPEATPRFARPNGQ
jgi:hypothetical protein